MEQGVGEREIQRVEISRTIVKNSLKDFFLFHRWQEKISSQWLVGYRGFQNNLCRCPNRWRDSRYCFY